MGSAAPVRTKRVVPDEPIDMLEVVTRFPTIRQSLMADFDDCALSTLFKIRYEGGWSTSPQARGTIFHRTAAECLRRMKVADSEGIPVWEAMEVLEWAIEQRDVDPRDIVRLPMREIPVLEMAVRKFAFDNRFNIRNVVDIERRLSATITYADEDGLEIRRVLTGQPDAVIAAPNNEAVVLDWKDTWSLPPARDPNAEDPGVSYHGYFQQMFYAYLIFENYPVEAVTLREFYARRKQKREARLTRAELPRIRRRLATLAFQFDRAIAAGAPPRLTLDDLDEHGHWKPSPGYHCGWCRKAHLCPIDDDYKLAGGVRGPEDASRLAGMRQTAKSIVKRIDEKLQPYAEAHGPIPVKRAKGRLVLGYRGIAEGKKSRWEEFVPTDADRPSRTETTPKLEEALRASAERHKTEKERLA